MVKDTVVTVTGPPCVLNGVLHVYVAYDLGDEIRLDTAKQLVLAEFHRLPRHIRTPISIAYQREPLRICPTPIELTLPDFGTASAQVDLTVFDFAGATVGLHVPFRIEASLLWRAAGALADATFLVEQTTHVLRPIYQKILPAIQSPRWSDLTEEYFVFQFLPDESFPTIDRLMADQGEWLAGLVRLDPVQFATSEVGEALRSRLSYGPADLVIADWAAAVIVDRDCDEILETMAFANLQLLEFRQIDRRLERQLQEAYALIHTLARRWLPFWRSYHRPLRVLGEMKVDANEMFERSSNGLKLIGDQYVARVYQLVAARLYLEKWADSVRNSLRVLEGIYQVVADQAATLRNEILEWIIIALIFFEVVMALMGR